MSFLNSTTRTRPDQTHGPLGSPTSPPTLSGHRPVRSISTCTDFVRGSGLVWSGRRQSPCVRLVEFRNDTTRPDQRQSLQVGPVWWNLDMTGSVRFTCCEQNLTSLLYRCSFRTSQQHCSANCRRNSLVCRHINVRNRSASACDNVPIFERRLWCLNLTWN